MINPSDWRGLPISQKIDWPDPKRYQEAVALLKSQPTLVFPGEIEDLKRALEFVESGKAFLIQAGDCAEEFAKNTSDSIENRLKLIFQLGSLLQYGSGFPIVRVVRMAGQYGKPRSKLIELINGEKINTYRGDIINGSTQDAKIREADPMRMVWAYQNSAVTLNYIRSFCSGGLTDLDQVPCWNSDLFKNSPLEGEFQKMVSLMEDAIHFKRCQQQVVSEKIKATTSIFTSHEALVLDYEESLTRKNSDSKVYYGGSAHFLWIGERTRAPGQAHSKFLSSLSNPIGVKLGPLATSDEVDYYLNTLNPQQERGKLVFITRLGVKAIQQILPRLIQKVKNLNRSVIWICDPMHGNTFFNNGIKTRNFDDILEETRLFFEILNIEKAHPGGIHFEMTPETVTECLGGHANITPAVLPKNYKSLCDPRLNGFQSLELALKVGSFLKTTCQKIN